MQDGPPVTGDCAVSETWSTLGGAELLEDGPQVLDGRYELGEIIGRGGFGAVWRATDLERGSEVAIKQLPALGDGPLRELSALWRLDLPGVVRLEDVLIERTQIWLVMALVEGIDFLGPRDRACWQDRVGSLEALLGTLSQVHLAGVVHGDLKPSNVRLTTAGRPVLIDFGIAAGASVRAHRRRMEGTAAFMAPEQLDGRPLGPRTDLYALGRVVLAWLDAEDRLAPPEAWGWARWLCQAAPEDRPPDAAAALARLVGVTPRQLPESMRGLGDAEQLGDGFLQSLFHGPALLLHLPEDAARALQGRAGRLAGDVRRELQRWCRTGHCWLDGDKLRVGRGTVDRLLFERDVGSVEVAREARRKGRYQAAWSLVHDALERARSAPDKETELLAEMVLVAGELNTDGHLRVVRYELARARHRGSDVTELEALVRAQVLLRAKGNGPRDHGDQSARAVTDMGIELTGELALHGHRLRLRSALVRANRAEAEVELQALHQAAAEGLEGAHCLGLLGRGLLAYRRGDYLAAAQDAERAGEVADRFFQRVAALLNASSAWLEAHRPDLAYTRAAAARELALRVRHVTFELRAVRLQRAAAYRGGQAVAADADLIDAAEAAHPRLAGMMALTESAIAWRGRDLVAARALVARSLKCLHASTSSWEGTLALALSAALDDPQPPGHLEELAAGVRSLPGPDLITQGLGLLRLASTEDLWLDEALRVAARCEGTPSGARLDLLSLQEATVSESALRSWRDTGEFPQPPEHHEE